MIHATLLNKSTIVSDYLGEEIYNLLDQTFEIPTNYSYNIFHVTREYIARPDLISLDAYGDTMFGDVICKLNGISNPFELNEGMLIILPAPENILDFIIKPNPKELETYTEIVPTAKTKQSTRKTNEAILGDSRFKINPSDGVIIY